GVLPPPAAPFSPDPTAGAPQIDIENTTFTNETAAAIVDAADHNAFSVDAASRLLGKAPGDPALDVWAGPAPWLGIADIVYLNDVPQHGRFWQVRPAGDVPSARFGAGMCWDGASRRFVLYGGAAARGFDDTFTLDPSTFAWRVATDARLDLGTGRRLDVAMASSFPGKSCLLFGGQSGDAVDVVYADLYRFVVNPQTLEPEWHKLSPACTPRCPDARFGASLSALDDHRYLLVGGRGAGGQFWGEWWIYDADANTWTDRTVATAPMYVAEHAATTAGGAGVLIYGGQDQNGSARDTAFVFDKSLDDGTHSPWRPVAIGSAAAGPGARSLLGMAIVPRGGDRRDRYVAFGGSDGVNYGDTGAVLVADGLVAGNFEATTGPRPSARGHYAMASSADLAKAAIASESLAGTTVVLFGGDPGVGQSPLADTWVYVVSAP
ncbi:MAG TPA: kelch repeat-containing protein, partial [Haliangiales bacterium]|nr:kelch repeat-containing protein [Haliangiales bacterium]